MDILSRLIGQTCSISKFSIGGGDLTPRYAMCYVVEAGGEAIYLSQADNPSEGIGSLVVNGELPACVIDAIKKAADFGMPEVKTVKIQTVVPRRVALVSAKGEQSEFVPEKLLLEVNDSEFIVIDAGPAGPGVLSYRVVAELKETIIGRHVSYAESEAWQPNNSLQADGPDGPRA